MTAKGTANKPPNEQNFARQGCFLRFGSEITFREKKTPLMGIYGEEKTIKKRGHEL